MKEREVDYGAALEAELNKFEALLVRRRALKAELSDVCVELSACRTGVLGLAALANVDVRGSRPDLLKPEFEAHLRLVDAITKALEEVDTTRGYSVDSIREEIEDAGFPIATFTNPKASITDALDRLVDAGKLLIATDNDTKTAVYFLSHGFGAACLKRQDDDREEAQRRYGFNGKLDESGAVEYEHFHRVQTEPAAT